MGAVLDTLTRTPSIIQRNMLTEGLVMMRWNLQFGDWEFGIHSDVDKVFYSCVKVPRNLQKFFEVNKDGFLVKTLGGTHNEFAHGYRGTDIWFRVAIPKFDVQMMPYEVFKHLHNELDSLRTPGCYEKLRNGSFYCFLGSMAGCIYFDLNVAQMISVPVMATSFEDDGLVTREPSTFRASFPTLLLGEDNLPDFERFYQRITINKTARAKLLVGFDSCRLPNVVDPTSIVAHSNLVPLGHWDTSMSMTTLMSVMVAYSRSMVETLEGRARSYGLMRSMWQIVAWNHECTPVPFSQALYAWADWYERAGFEDDRRTMRVGFRYQDRADFGAF